MPTAPDAVAQLKKSFKSLFRKKQKKDEPVATGTDTTSAATKPSETTSAPAPAPSATAPPEPAVPSSSQPDKDKLADSAEVDKTAKSKCTCISLPRVLAIAR